MKKIIILAIIVIAVIAAVFGYVYLSQKPADQGNVAEKADLIKVDNIKPNQKITSPLTITGQARGTWYFEAVFPINLLDANGNVIATAQAQAKSDWMTENFVPFQATIEFQKPAKGGGVLILKKDNPSGLPQNADELRIPVRF